MASDTDIVDVVESVEQEPKRKASRKVSSKRGFDQAVVLDRSSLTRLLDYLKSKYQRVKVEAACNDGTTFEWEETEELLNYGNPDFRKILALSVRARRYTDEPKSKYAMDSPNTAYIKFGDLDLIVHAKAFGLRSTAFILVEGEDDRVIAVFEELCKQVESLNPEHSSIYDWALSLGRRATFSTCFGLFVIACWILLDRLLPISRHLGIAGAMILGCGMGYWSSHWSGQFYTRTCERILIEVPPVLLAIGDQSKRPAQGLAFQSKIHNATLGAALTLGVGVLASLFANLIWEQAK